MLIEALRRVEIRGAGDRHPAVKVEAIDESARRFCEKYGFLTLADDPQHLFLPMHVIRKLKLPPL